MTCPNCENNTMVIDSRPTVDSVNRRRQCINCGFRFNTVEIDEEQYALLIGININLVLEKINKIVNLTIEKMEKVKNDLNNEKYGI